MHSAERINVLFFAFIAALALLLPLPRRRRFSALTIGAAGSALCVLASFSPAFLPDAASRLIRDWLPAPLILAVYHQSGQLFTKPWGSFQTWLMDLDRRLLGRPAGWRSDTRINRFLLAYLETAYLTCYPLIPAALGTLYLLGRHDEADLFWAAVLPPTYFCYALVPILPAYPPRRILQTHGTTSDASGIRRFNLWLLQYGSIHANTFPSAHVAACMAASLFLLRVHLPSGICFLWISLSIAVAVVVLRYHYVADSLLAVILSLAPFLFLR